MRQKLGSVLFSNDASVIRTVRAYGEDLMKLSLVETPGDFYRTIEQRRPAVVLLDYRAEGAIDIIRSYVKDRDDLVFVILAEPESDAWEAALDAEAFAVEAITADGRQLQTVLSRACHHAALTQEVRALKTRMARGTQGATPATPPAPAHAEGLLSLRQMFAPLRHFDDVDALLQGIVENIAGATSVLRVGMFARIDNEDTYRLAAGVGCLDSTHDTEFDEDDFLVRWLETNAQLVTRSNLLQTEEIAEKLNLESALDAMGAELIAPLQRHTRLIGWLFLGKRATGTPFSTTDLQDTMAFADHATTALENVLMFQEIAQQKSFAETLLHSLPTGIIAVNLEGRVDWFNDAAEHLLLLHRDDVLGKPARNLGPLLARALNETLHGMQESTQPVEWMEDRSRRQLSARTVRLVNGDFCWGAVAFVTDLTRERMLSRKQQEIERSSFWTELAAGMSHEIRNPLVAIKTFSQLLPERYADPDFRDQFSSLVIQEVGRLDAVIQQINRFANLPAAQKEVFDLREALVDAEAQARMLVPQQDTKVAMNMPKSLPLVLGDKQALTQCFANIIVNALEAMAGRTPADVKVSVDVVAAGSDTPTTLVVEFIDEAGGIPPDIRGHVLSPFCTTKERAMGLGLPIVQRTVADHEGHIDVTSDSKGTRVRITLPLADTERDKEATLSHETAANRR